MENRNRTPITPTIGTHDVSRVLIGASEYTPGGVLLLNPLLFEKWSLGKAINTTWSLLALH